MPEEKIGTEEKALQINLDGTKYGTFAEIGAGQEVVRWFFHVGRSSGTVAKAMSAYDMVVSDEIYGAATRYVSRQRLEAMLDHEWTLLLERLDCKRGEKTCFFAFADTVATHRASQKAEGHGWLGIRFQHEPRAEASNIILHVRMLDAVSTSEQEAVGALGVNLIYAALYYSANPALLVASLMDRLTRERVEIDMIKLSGPAFPNVDNRLIALQMVEQNLTDATMFTADGGVVQLSEVLYQKPILLERGSFRPVTNVTLDMLNKAARQFSASGGTGCDNPMVIFEMTLNNLKSGPEIDHEDFLARADVLGSLGKAVLVSNFTRFDKVTSCLRRASQNWIGLVVGFPTLGEIFDQQYYADLQGGMLEGIGLLFQGKTRLYVYPTRDGEDGRILTAGDLRVHPSLYHVYAHCIENGFIETIRDFDEQQLHILPNNVLAHIQAGDPIWEKAVPAEAAAVIKQRRLFGYVETVQA